MFCIMTLGDQKKNYHCSKGIAAVNAVFWMLLWDSYKRIIHVKNKSSVS